MLVVTLNIWVLIGIFDDLFALAAEKTFVSCEQVVATEDLASTGPVESIRVSRLFTDGVVEAPFGAHFTHCVPDYYRDETIQREYVASAKADDGWATFRARYIDIPESDYQALARASLATT